MLKKILRGILKPVLRFLCIIVFRVRKVNEEYIPKEGAFILCGNHVGTMDAVTLVLCTKRKVNFVAKAELFKHASLRFLAYVFDVIPIKRGAKDLEAMKKCINVLKNGEILGIFPEGTRKGLEKKEKAKTGAAFLALRNDVPIIPVGIQGSFRPFTRVTLNYGSPLNFHDFAQKNPEKEVLEKVTEDVMDEIVRLTNEQV